MSVSGIEYYTVRVFCTYWCNEKQTRFIGNILIECENSKMTMYVRNEVKLLNNYSALKKSRKYKCVEKKKKLRAFESR